MFTSATLSQVSCIAFGITSSIAFAFEPPSSLSCKVPNEPIPNVTCAVVTAIVEFVLIPWKKETVKPLSNSVEALVYKSISAAKCLPLPVSVVVESSVEKTTYASPVREYSTAFDAVATAKDPAKAESPICFSLFIILLFISYSYECRFFSI